MTRIFLAFAAIFGGLSVAAGAFASHALRETLSERALQVFDTASCPLPDVSCDRTSAGGTAIESSAVFPAKPDGSWVGFYHWHYHFLRQSLRPELD